MEGPIVSQNFGVKQLKEIGRMFSHGRCTICMRDRVTLYFFNYKIQSKNVISYIRINVQGKIENKLCYNVNSVLPYVS
jgi:hypothetical protein